MFSIVLDAFNAKVSSFDLVTEDYPNFWTVVSLS